jgi:hypothetical protein
MTNWKTPPQYVETPDGSAVLNITGAIVLVKALIEDAKPHLRPQMKNYLAFLESHLTNLTLVKGESK